VTAPVLGALSPPGDRRAQVSLGPSCTHACTFCAQRATPSAANEGVDPPIESLNARTRALRASGARGVTFVGGEPTLRPDALEAAVRVAKDAGFVAIGMQTNGHRLAALAPVLAAAGLTDVHVSLHGAEAAHHDHHTGRPGSFEAVWEGVAAARAQGLRVVVTTVLTRSNFRVLAPLPLLLRSRGIDAWHVAVPLARGRADDGFDRVVPRLALALPFALHALDASRRLGLPAFVSGAPLCLLGPFAARSLDVDAPGSRGFHATCEECGARAACPGVDPLYLARFDGDELRPRADVPRGASDEPWAALFVGPGELAPPRDGPVHAPARASRVHLPMLGRTNRAVNEASTRTTRTGESLRALFPDLFAGDAKGPQEG